MKCPADGSDLVMSDRQGIEIDYCPKCRGVWLDRGELDKIIERSASQAAPAPAPQPAFAPPPPPAYQQAPYPPQKTYDPRYAQGHHGYGHKKRKSFLGEIFDFD